MNLLLLAIAPVMVVIVWIYYKDKIEKEPKSFLFKNFIFGATVSVIITWILSAVVNSVYPLLKTNDIFETFLKAFIYVALIEEFAKYVIVRFLAQPNKEFNEKFDGIVYAVMVSMGFACLENILYVFEYGVKVGFLRAFTAVPAHATFGVLMGYFMGQAKFSENRVQKNITGLLIATFFHGAYDFFLFLEFIPNIHIAAIGILLIGFFSSKRFINLS